MQHPWDHQVLVSIAPFYKFSNLNNGITFSIVLCVCLLSMFCHRITLLPKFTMFCVDSHLVTMSSLVYSRIDDIWVVSYSDYYELTSASILRNPCWCTQRLISCGSTLGVELLCCKKRMLLAPADSNCFPEWLCQSELLHSIDVF